MQDEIYRMIPTRLVPVAQHRVVEEIGKASERPVQTGFPARPPIRVPEDKSDIAARRFPNTRIEQQPLIVENEPGLKAIRKRQQSQDA